MPLFPGQEFRLTKGVWTHEDFEKMGWHDVTIHALAFEPEKFEVFFDIDYIFAWVNPEPPSPGYSFFISPATLVFKNVVNFSSDFDAPVGLQILSVSRTNPRPPRNADFIDLKTEWDWHIELVTGELTLVAAGFEQFTRQKPIRNRSAQCFSQQERNGISFERTVLEI